MKPYINIKCVASQYEMPNERIIEVSSKSGGCLISIREYEGSLMIELYRLDDTVKTRINRRTYKGVNNENR